MSMSEELADTHAAEGIDTGVQSAEILDAPSDKPQSIREALTASIKEVGDKEQRARDIASGKFIPKDKASAETAAAEVPETTKDVQPEPVKAAGPPPGWSAESKAFFNSLPPDHPLRQDVFKREEEVSNGFKSYSEKSKNYDSIEQAVAPFRNVYQQHGLKSDAEAVSRLFQWEASIRNPETRMGAIHNLLRQYGVDLSQFAQGSTQPSAAQDIPEHLRPVLDEVGNLSKSFSHIQQELQQAKQEKIAGEISAFSKDKPHFEKVRVAMGQMMAAGIVQSNDLEGAYQRAVWADPELRDQLLKEQDEKRKAEFAKTQAQAGKNARLAAVSPPPRARQGAQVNGSDKSGKNVRGSIMASIEQLREDSRA